MEPGAQSQSNRHDETSYPWARGSNRNASPHVTFLRSAVFHHQDESEQRGPEVRGGTRPWEETAFEALFRTHFGGVYRLVFRIVGSRPEAEDLVQETFVRCYRNGSPTDAAFPIRAWLYRVATNLALNAQPDHGRLRARHERADNVGAVVGDPACDPVEQIAREEQRTRVRQILDTLHPRQSRLLILRHAGLSYQELAKTLEIAPGSVGTLLARAEAAFEKAYRSTTGSTVPTGERKPDREV